ncbi:hypothetical protein [uncultured Desulfobulbus sp.]|uniref:hypothetical protein n=1 Tax=uncultured Desulfobulbus sp. TaxID=239745 RepID=UPI0029C77500|nr:hypothetical protein [uncultured Desulfobulbus sp.]
MGAVKNTQQKIDLFFFVDMPDSMTQPSPYPCPFDPSRYNLLFYRDIFSNLRHSPTLKVPFTAS